MMPAHTFFEDVWVGQESVTPSMTLTEAHVALYAGLAHHPSDDPGTIPVLLPLCLSTGLGWRVPEPPLFVLAFMGLEWTVRRPIHVGDTIGSRSRILAKRAMREGGVVVEERQVFDQRGEVVQQGRFTFLVGKRSKEDAG